MISEDEARERQLPGWNIRCNRCGNYGATWLLDTRPRWGAYAACPPHARDIGEELSRHAREMAKLTPINFEQRTSTHSR